MKQAYDFAVEHVGIDFHSTTLWADYINFLKSEYVLIGFKKMGTICHFYIGRPVGRMQKHRKLMQFEKHIM